LWPPGHIMWRALLFPSQPLSQGVSHKLGQPLAVHPGAVAALAAALLTPFPSGLAFILAHAASILPEGADSSLRITTRHPAHALRFFGKLRTGLLRVSGVSEFRSW